MIFQSPQNPNSHLTVKQRRYPSFPTKQLFLKGLIKGKVLDFGCGIGVDVGFLEQKGLNVSGYDPHYQPEYPVDRFDTILCNYVLNVLLPEEQAHVLMAISELLNPNGKAYFTVRRDIRRNGFRYNPKHQCKTYQCNVLLPYQSIMLTEHCEIYEYQHINQIKHTPGKNGCHFCHPSPEYKLVTESATAYAVFMNRKTNCNQIAIIPKRHTESYFELSFKEQCACWLMLNRVKSLLQQQGEMVKFQCQVTSENLNTSRHVHTHIIFDWHVKK